MKEFTLILGGGGVWGVAWMTGLVQGLAEQNCDLRKAHAFIGTSAGSIVSAQLASGIPADTLYQRQTEPALQPTESPAPPLSELGAMLRPAPSLDQAARVLRAGKIAMSAETVPYEQRRADIVARLGLPTDAWPSKRLLITAVDCNNGALSAFDASSGVNLIDAVAASCAVPGIWPTTPINGRLYMDGGVWKTPENAHLAHGAERIVIISPVGTAPPFGPQLNADMEALKQSGSVIALIAPDANSVAAQSFGLLNLASRKPAAEAGRAQAPLVAETLHEFL